MNRPTVGSVIVCPMGVGIILRVTELAIYIFSTDDGIIACPHLWVELSMKGEHDTIIGYSRDEIIGWNERHLDYVFKDSILWK